VTDGYLPLIGSVEWNWTADGQRLTVWNSRQPEPGQPRVHFTPAEFEAFIGRVRAGEYGPGTPPPPRTVPLADTLGDRQVLKRPGRSSGPPARPVSGHP
jgi:hypothetical protein